MKSIFESLIIAMSMYSAIPVPIINWNEKNMKNAMCFFPVIGLFCALGLWAIIWISRYFGVSSVVLFSALAVAVNVFITGGLHIDGFCDTADALFSRRDMEEKLRILKDPNCGPFAVLAISIVLLLQVGAYSEIYLQMIFHPSYIVTIGLVFMLSRCLSGISVTRFTCAKTSSLAKAFGSQAGKNVSYVLIILTVIISAWLIYLNRIIGVAVVISSFIVFLYYYRMSKKYFGGITGDLAGYFLVICETMALLVIAILV